MDTKLQKLVDKFRSDINDYKSEKFNEASTRSEFIDPFLKILGWDVHNENDLNFSDRIILPEEVQNSTDRPDYTIKINGEYKMFIEAKKPNVDISSDNKSANQTRRYGWNGGMKVSVLTNFEYLVIYETTHEPLPNDNFSKYRKKVYHFEEYVEFFDEIFNLISFQSFMNGKFDEWTESLETAETSKNTLDEVFLTKLNEWRLMIGIDLYNSSPEIYCDAKKMNEEVQSFLNQLIFLRFAEDNKFETYQTLLSKSIQKKQFITLIADSELKYNSGIFEKLGLINSLSEDTISSIIKQLYYPENSYDFKIINLLILGTIYENFLQKELIIDNGEVKLEKTMQAQIKSVVTTPENIVRSITKKALKEKITGKSPEEIYELKICDLAVGAGTFLVSSFDYIEDYLVDWYSKSLELKQSKSIVPFEVKRQILKKTFWGFDIDYNAIQLTVFSLALRLLRNEKNERVKDFQPILPQLFEQIRCGNSLVNETDFNINEISNDEYFKINPEEKEFKDLKFDIILGNPPYLSTEDMRNASPEKEFEIYSEKYESACLQFDKYFLFIEESIRRLNETGKCVMIIPNKFITTKSVTNLRKFLKDRKSIMEILDFGSKQLFKNLSTYVSIVTFEINSTGYLKYQLLDDIQDIENTKITNVPYEILDDKLWFLTNDRTFIEQYQKIKKAFPLLIEEFEITNGVQSSANTIYVLKDKYKTADTGDYVTYEINGDEVLIEKSILKPFYKPAPKTKNKSYQDIIIESHIIYPYENGKLIPITDMEINFPNTWKYLLKNFDKLKPKHLFIDDVVKGKRDVPHAKEETWYHYGRSQNLNMGEYEEKILVGVLKNEPIFNIDKNQCLFESGGTAGYVGIIKKENSPYTHEYLVAWLSHPLSDKIAKSIGSSFEGDFYTSGTHELKKTPLLPIDFNNPEEKQIFEQINNKVKEVYLKNSEIRIETRNQNKNLLSRQKSSLIEGINALLDLLLSRKGVL